MIPSIAKLGVPYVLMHMRGNPSTMNSLAEYADVTAEVIDFLIQKVQVLRSAGIVDIIADPGIGFAKTAAHNFQLINNLTAFQLLHVPILLGMSRKSFISKSLNVTSAESLNGTTVLNTIALLKGANILRVHDVKAAVEAIRLTTLAAAG
jgi:dihydropteroate synthase